MLAGTLLRKLKESTFLAHNSKKQVVRDKYELSENYKKLSFGKFYQRERQISGLNLRSAGDRLARSTLAEYKHHRQKCLRVSGEIFPILTVTVDCEC